MLADAMKSIRQGRKCARMTIRVSPPAVAACMHHVGRFPLVNITARPADGTNAIVGRWLSS